MSTEIKVPVLPESVADATVATWHKQAGDSIRRDENLVDLETDKVVLEVPSPVDGVITKISRDSGETVTSGELLGLIEEGVVEAATEPVADVEQASEAETGPVAAPDSAKPSPAARRIAEEEQADLSQVAGTGRGGRITKGDVINYVRNATTSGQRPEERVKIDTFAFTCFRTHERGTKHGRHSDLV